MNDELPGVLFVSGLGFGLLAMITGSVALGLMGLFLAIGGFVVIE